MTRGEAVKDSEHVARIYYAVGDEADAHGRRMPARTLEVEYRGGRVYWYFEVPLDRWMKLQQAKSKGSYLRQVIQKEHKGQEVK